MLRQYSPVIKMLVVILGAIALCRVTDGYAFFGVVLVAMGYISKHKMGHVLLCFMFIPLLAMTNWMLIGRGGMMGAGARLSTVVLTVLLAVQSTSRKGSHALPVGMLYLYLVIAVISSIEGWCPIISYMKILNFLFFLMSIHLGTRNIHLMPEELEVVRTGLLAYATFVILGSVMVIPFPAIGYSMMIAKQIAWGNQDSIANIAAGISQSSGVKLFCGVLNHSQSFSPMVVACFCWVTCDMLLVEKRMDPLHLLLIALTPVLLYMSRSRIGLLGFVVGVLLINFYALNKARLSCKIKTKFTNVVIVAMVILSIGGVALEIKNQTFSRWLRKTDDVEMDQRTLAEAVTSSRMGKIEMNLEYFRSNPFFGTGFQVEHWHQSALDSGRLSMFSAPIEKGVLPLMVLGETGVVGSVVFVLFLAAFYATCAKKRYVATMVLFTIMLVLNMAEAVFFSPAAAGGCFWVILVVGGYVIDMLLVGRSQRESCLYFSNEGI